MSWRRSPTDRRKHPTDRRKRSFFRVRILVDTYTRMWIGGTDAPFFWSLKWRRPLLLEPVLAIQKASRSPRTTVGAAAGAKPTRQRSPPGGVWGASGGTPRPPPWSGTTPPGVPAATPLAFDLVCGRMETWTRGHLGTRGQKERRSLRGKDSLATLQTAALRRRGFGLE